jgi:DNA-binding NarL/FixJ family response regulator
LKALIVDDHPLIQQALANVLLGVQPAVEVAVACDCQRALEMAGEGVEPDLVLLDLNLPGISGIPALKLWRSRFPAIPIVVLSALDDQKTILAAIAAGAAGYVPKSSSNEVMARALELVLAGGKYLPPEVLVASGARAPMTAQAPASLESLGLTERQLAVLRLLAKGASNKSICRELGLAERTVKAHVTAIMRSLKVSSRTQAAVEAVRLGVVDGSR